MRVGKPRVRKITDRPSERPWVVTWPVRFIEPAADGSVQHSTLLPYHYAEWWVAIIAATNLAPCEKPDGRVALVDISQQPEIQCLNPQSLNTQSLPHSRPTTCASATSGPPSR